MVRAGISANTNPLPSAKSIDDDEILLSLETMANSAGVDTRRRSASESNRDRIVSTAAELLAEGGREAVSTRAVSAAAGIQAPTIYRLFGDMRGLLDAVAVYGFTKYLSDKTNLQFTDDPVEDLRSSWDLNVRFGLANPALYSLLLGEPRPNPSPPAAAVAAAEMLAARIHRIAEVGRLRVSEEHAEELVRAANAGTTLNLISTPEDRRDLVLSTMAREAVIAAITTDVPVSATRGPAGAAVALRAVLPEVSVLTATESALLTEWLDRIIDDSATHPS